MDRHWGTTIRSVTDCQKPWPDCYDMINQSLEEATEQSTTVTSSKSAGRRRSTTLRKGYLKIRYQLFAEGRGAKKRFQYCANPISSNQFLYLRAIQGHSGDNAIDHALKDNAITERIYLHLPRRGREWIEFQEEEASREEDKRNSPLQWIRWMTNMVWKKLQTIWRNQGSRHTRILGHTFKIQYVGAIWSSLKRKACNFTKKR